MSTARGGRRVVIRGLVQGIGMRPAVARLARELDLTGSVGNDGEGVVIEVFGDEPALTSFLGQLAARSPPSAVLEKVEIELIAPRATSTFEIIPSAARGPRKLTIPPDLATCPRCLAELKDPRDRRYLYVFTHCTACGPRLSMVRAVPYDRERTSMGGFPMCEDCRREYETEADRRYHAETTACPRCGPKLLVFDEGVHEPSTSAALTMAKAALGRGEIVAIKGFGGFHLAADATSPSAVATLRERKRRAHKPFAVMVASLEMAQTLVHLDACERELLCSSARPIVLAKRRAEATIAPAVAPATSLLGIMLPYSPLHELLLAEVACPLVITSANLAGEPIIHRNERMRAQRAHLAELVLAHDREVVLRADDSVARVIAGAPMFLRRARGVAPRPVHVARPFALPTLACGAALKNTFCIGHEDTAVLSPHQGDLDSPEAYAAFAEAVAHFESLLGITPRLLAHDLHPDIPATRYARARAKSAGIRAIGVQHHHAHVVAVMAEQKLEGPVLGVAFDGSGYGEDGAMWGGEFLLATRRRATRLATLFPLRLAGGDLAVREPWRLALAMLDEAFAGQPPLARLELFAQVAPEKLAVVRRMLATGLNTPRAHGAGRLFDAAAALILARPSSSYEAELVSALEAVTPTLTEEPYPFEIDTTAVPWQLDWRPTARALTHDLVAEVSPALAGARFHRTVVAMTAMVVTNLLAQHRDTIMTARGSPVVVLGGGCFQNARLTEGLLTALRDTAAVFLPREVPIGDGGVALGQAIIAAALAAE